jgi:hypothetical protein
MNDRYFACPACRIYTSAGYRWAYWSLEHAGIVRPNLPIDVASVQAHSEYWHPETGPDTDWLYSGVFPLVRAFFEEHNSHGILYVESGDFYDIEDFEAWRELTEL